MNFIFLTLFPELIKEYMQHSIVRRAILKQSISVYTLNPREFATDKHSMVDDIPFGGGPGMVLKPEPWVAAIKSAKEYFPKSKVVAMSPEGSVLSSNIAYGLAKENFDLIFLCGHYEGFDARIYKYVDERISIGDYVLTGGELAALVTMDACMRFLDGVLGNSDSAANDSFSSGLLEHPHYTRPVEFEGMVVPEVLRSGNHKLINQWRKEQSLLRTWKYRPDLLDKSDIQPSDRKLLEEILLRQNGEDDE